MEVRDLLQLSSLRGALEPASAGNAAKPASTPFAEELRGALGEANRTLNAAEQSSEKLARGEVDIVETMIALGKADLSLRFVVSLRNRALEAYNEIMRLQV